MRRNSVQRIKSKIIKRHPRRDETDSGLMVDYGRREMCMNKEYEELCFVSIQDVRDRRSISEGVKRSGVKIEKK